MQSIFNEESGSSPRMRGTPLRIGECGGKRVRDLGSSPRMRGTLIDLVGIVPFPRIIPADAGNTNRIDSQYSYRKDHPRGCGEHRCA